MQGSAFFCKERNVLEFFYVLCKRMLQQTSKKRQKNLRSDKHIYAAPYQAHSSHYLIYAAKYLKNSDVCCF